MDPDKPGIEGKRRHTPVLPLAGYRLSFEAREPVGLPEYAGSAWRGIFGHALKRTVCVTREKDCVACLLYRSCAYPWVFETPPPEDSARMRRYRAAPHPYVLIPENRTRRTVPTGGTFDLGMNLFGRGNEYFPYIVQSFRVAGEGGIGRGKGRFALKAVRQTALARGGETVNWREGETLSRKEPERPAVPAVPDTVRLVFETPLRVRSADHLVGPGEFAFHHLFRNLLRRISSLMFFHGGTPLDVDFAALVGEATTVACASRELRWCEWTRWSSRQKTTMQMGGLVGEISLAGSTVGPFWPYLWLGQWTHAGKGATMGLGRYRIETPDVIPAAGVGSEPGSATG
ncbi:MAG: CRISPR system precrRNA processing endoribonuclease RAMP protein Cas6 [Pseudomonadota bacterium]|nr:CRISPR system precrRNA processing endoribonuclease RAMP protein Cas6 [Pseudomonadota bacterium]